MLLLLPSDIFQGTELKFTLIHCSPEVYLFLFLKKKKTNQMHLTSAPVCVDGGSPMLLFRTKHVRSQRSRFYHSGASCQATRSIDHLKKKKKKKLVRGQQHIYPIYSQLITRDQFDRWRTLKDVAKE